MSRPWTQKEVQEKFIRHMWDLVNWWANETRKPTAREKLEGLLHSFLATLDGDSGDLPAYTIIPDPHPSDKNYHIDQEENYYQPFELPDGTITVHGENCLHEIMYRYK
jgi:hypothetical protein